MGIKNWNRWDQFQIHCCLLHLQYAETSFYETWRKFLECPDDHTQTFCDGSIFQAVLTKLEGTGEGTDEDSNQLVFIYLCCQ